MPKSGKAKFSCPTNRDITLTSPLITEEIHRIKIRKGGESHECMLGTRWAIAYCKTPSSAKPQNLCFILAPTVFR